jgi:hypothetical protein
MEREPIDGNGVEVRVVTLHERVESEHLAVDRTPDERLQVHDLTGREHVILIQLQARVGDDVVGTEGSSLSEELGQEHDRRGHRPDPAPARHDEEIEIAVAIEVEVRDAAGERNQPSVGEPTDEREEDALFFQEAPAERLALPSFGDEVPLASQEEQTLVVFDHSLERWAALVSCQNLRRGLLGGDERLPQLGESQRKVEERGV